MSIYIKGARKPKNCQVCVYNQSDCYCCFTNGTINRDDWTCEKPCPIYQIPKKLEYGSNIFDKIRAMSNSDVVVEKPGFDSEEDVIDLAIDMSIMSWKPPVDKEEKDA